MLQQFFVGLPNVQVHQLQCYRNISEELHLYPMPGSLLLIQDLWNMDALTMHSLFTQMGCANLAASAIVDDQGINRLHEL